MRVHVYPADHSGCGHYRLIWPAQALAAEGHDVTVFPAGEQDTLKVLVIGERDVVLAERPECDVVVIQRPLHWTWAHVIPQLRKHGIRVVVDIDDDFRNVHRDNPVWRQVQPRYSPDMNYEHLEDALDAADWITVSTPALGIRHGGRGGFSLIPNCVPERYLNVPPAQFGGPVGWAGSVPYHNGDLDVLNGLLTEWTLIGDPTGAEQAVGTAPRVVPWQSIERYPETLAALSVGVVPLALNKFNEAKSWLKGLEMASVGMPFIATPTRPYRDLAAGILATTPDEWRSALHRLTTESDLWHAEGHKNRKIAQQWTIENNLYRWEKAWT